MKRAYFALIITAITLFSLPSLSNAADKKIFQLAQATPPAGTCNIVDPVAKAQALAAFYHVPYPAKNSLALSDLIDCVTSHVPAGMIDGNQIYSYQQNPDLINYTRGNQICGLDVACASNDCHEVNSCHFGGRTGTNGAEAVDFNARVGTTENQLYDAIHTVVFPGGACFGKAKYILLEVDHTHLTTNSNAGCDITNIPSLPPTQQPQAGTTTPQSGAKPAPKPIFLVNPIGVKDPQTLAIRIIQIFLGFLGIIGLIMFIFGGFLMLTSAGNADRVKKAKATLLWAAVGILVIVGSYTILSFVFSLLIK